MARPRILIMGGTSGIGLHAAKKLSEQYDVVIAGRRVVEVEPPIKYIGIDVLNERSVEGGFEELKTEGADLAGLVYSTGITTKRLSIEEFNYEEWQTLFNTNLTGAILCLKYAYPMLTAAKGRVVLLNSFAARTYSQFSGFQYTTSKAALTGLARQLAVDWAPDEILVNSLYPSMTKTPMLEENDDSEFLAKIESTIPLRRIASQNEVTAAIEFLLSSSNTYMTGCGLDLNGGLFLN